MGKIKVRTLGNEEFENKQKQKAKQKSKEKKLVKGAKGGERIVSVGPSEEELASLQVPVTDTGQQTKTTSPIIVSKVKKIRSNRPKKIKSKNYQAAAKLVDRTKKYSLSEALTLLEKLKRFKFDETVELHINTTESGISGKAILPHGTGKSIKVAIADDEILSKVQKGIIDFDVLLSSPVMMPKLARVAKILGPRGLMPNPKNETLVKDPEKAAKSFKEGQVNFKTEAKIPVMHLTVGKMSFGEKKLSENIHTFINAIKKEKIKNATLKSTMSPGIKLEI